MAQENPHGDLVLTDPEVARLLAEPDRYTLLTHLQRHERTTVDDLASRLRRPPSEVETHLRVLAEHGLVREVAGHAWEALGRGLLVELPVDAAGQEATRLLTTRMFLDAAALPAPWWSDDEPRLPAEWRQVAGLINAGLWLTAAELRALDDRIEELTAPYATRTEADLPPGARRVRVQCYFMPEPD
jgi:DNA-binding transcriptional ArsR family regulator